jgi:hypothetical protein
LAITKVKSGVRTLGTGEVATANMAVDPTNASNLSSGSVPLAQLGNIDTTVLEDDIALLGFKVAVNGSLAKYNLVDQTEDAFMDATGIDATASTGEIRNAANYYSGVTATSVTATGGTISVDGDYTVHKFTGNGNFITDTEQDVRIMLIAGGGSGGVDAGGGGGAGGMIDTGAYNFTVSAATHAAVIGGGGASVGGESGGNSGVDSTFSTLTAKGGGGGGGWNAVSGPSSTGGSGGGGAQSTAPSGGTGSAATQPSQSGDSGTYGYGYAGLGGASSSNAGGGGGAGATAVLREGGSGKESNILVAASDVFYAGGGGGAAMSGSTTGSSSGGGGTGAAGTTNQSGGAGTVNTGSGGGGGAGGGSATSGAGGSGLLALRRETSLNTFVDMTLQSNATTAETTPTKGDIVMTYTNGAGTATLNTDLTAEFSADNGSTWTSTTLVAQGSTGTHLIVSAHDVTRTSTSGTAMKYRIKTFNQSAAKETRIQAVSLGWS